MTIAHVVLPDPVLLMPLGDSITDGGAKSRSYRFHLHKLLTQDAVNIRWVGSMLGVYDGRYG